MLPAPSKGFESLKPATVCTWPSGSNSSCPAGSAAGLLGATHVPSRKECAIYLLIAVTLDAMCDQLRVAVLACMNHDEMFQNDPLVSGKLEASIDWLQLPLWPT